MKAWPFTYNQSTVDASSCLFRFKRLRDRAHKTDSREVVCSTGTAVHSFARRYHEHCWKAGVETDLEAWPRIAEAVLVGSGLREEEKHDFLRLAEGFVNAEIIPGPRESVWLERVLRSKDGRFFGTPDRVIVGDGGRSVTIDDYKSYRSILSETECRRGIQLPWYAVLLADELPEAESFRLRVLFLRFARAISWTLDRAEIEAFRQWMHSRCDELDGLRAFPAKGGGHCARCDETGACPLVKSGEVKVISTAAEAQSVGERLCALDAQRKQLSANLRDWLKDARAPVELAGGSWDYHPARGMVYSVAEVVKAFRGYGVKDREVLAEAAIRAAGIKRIGKRAKLGKEDVAAILATGEETVKTRFGFRQPEGEDDGEDEA